jgi:mutator protein MutT
MIVTAGIIWRDGLVLIAQRKRDSRVEASKWEFPGGKLDPGETMEACLAREIQEELGLDIEVGKLYATNTHTYDIPSGPLLCELHAYSARWLGGEIQLLDCQDARWVQPQELRGYAFSAADIPIVERFLQEYA